MHTAASRRGRSALTLIAIAFAALAAGHPSPARAAVLPTTLSSEFLLAQPALVGTDSFAASGTCDASAPSTYTFSASGQANGVFEGTFTETGSFTIGGESGTNDRTLVAFESTFEIAGTNGITVTGTKHLLASQFGACSGGAAPRVNFVGLLAYDATITADDGTAVVQGTAISNGSTDPLDAVFNPSGPTFNETFVTTSPIAPPPEHVSLAPLDAIVLVGSEQCVTATVTDRNGDPSAGALARFAVTGALLLTDEAETDANGEAELCITGPALPGDVFVSAYADTNRDGDQDSFEPGSSQVAHLDFTVPAPVPASLVLDPVTATVPVGTGHCVTATVRDVSGSPLEAQAVRFTVSGPDVQITSRETGASGQATLCVPGPADFESTDTFHAYSDGNRNNAEDEGEPSADAAVDFVSPVSPPVPASLALAPATATKTVGSQHCVTATVLDQRGDALGGTLVRFAAAGATTASGASVTGGSGQAAFCYTGSAFPGSDAIAAYADADADGVADPDEPGATAAATWVLPPSSPACDITDHGQIQAPSGATADLSLKAFSSAHEILKGKQTFADPGTGLTLDSTALVAIECDAVTKRATIYGQAIVNGVSGFLFRVRLKEGSPSTYALDVSNGYATGERPLTSGTVRVG